MRIKFNKEIEFILKKKLIPEKYLLKKRLNRAIRNNYEEELQILDTLVDKNLQSIDIGVYRGVYSFKLSQISKHVHSFEPNPLIFPYLKKYLTKIISNITLYNYAASDKNVKTELRVPKRFNILQKDNYEERYKLGSSTIHKNNLLLKNHFTTFEVNAVRLDDKIKNGSIGFIKIDVEGHERNVIDGSKQLIKDCKPNLLVEIEARYTNEKVEDIINYINNFGYKSYYCENKNLINTNKLRDFRLKNNYIFIS